MSAKIFLAGAESDHAVKLFDQLGVRYRLASYYYLRKKSKAKLEAILYKTFPEDVVWLIDSGAFTYMDSMAAEFKKDPAKLWDSIEHYVDDYTAFLAAHKARVFAAVEMDLDELMQQDELIEGAGKWKKSLVEWHETDYAKDDERQYIPPPIIAWRKQIETSGVPILNVWHAERGKEGWNYQAANTKYNGISSKAADTIAKWFPMLNEARKQGSYVHGFGMTNVTWIRKYALYSCDSTSWMTRGRFGETVVFRNGKLAHFSNDHKEIRQKYRHLYEKNGIKWEDVERDDAQAINHINLLAWLLYSEYMYTRPTKDYWETEINGAPVGSLGAPRAVASEPEQITDEDREAIERSEKEIEREASTEKKVKDVKQSLRVLNNVGISDFLTEQRECNNCYLSDRCKLYEEDAQCRLIIEGLETDEDLQKINRVLIRMQYERTMFAGLQEKMDGAQLDKNTSYEVDRLREMIREYRDALAPVPGTDAPTRRNAVADMLASILSGREEPKRKQSEEDPEDDED